MTRRLSLFGATGSVGQSTLDLIRRDGEAWTVGVLTAHSDVTELARLAKEFRPSVAVIADEARYADLEEALAGTGIEAAAGADASAVGAGSAAVGAAVTSAGAASAAGGVSVTGAAAAVVLASGAGPAGAASATGSVTSTT